MHLIADDGADVFSVFNLGEDEQQVVLPDIAAGNWQRMFSSDDARFGGRSGGRDRAVDGVVAPLTATSWRREKGDTN